MFRVKRGYSLEDKVEFSKVEDLSRLECFESIVTLKRPRGCRGGKKH
jgi:hypothetical protein